MTEPQRFTSYAELEAKLAAARAEVDTLKQAALDRMKRHQLPRNLEAERAVVGALLFRGGHAEVFRLLGAEDFYHPALQAVYEALVELDQQSQPIDIITVAEQMRRASTIGKLQAYNGEAYLAELANNIATVENITEHASIVKNCALRRRLVDVGQRTVEAGFAEGPAAAKIDATMQDLLALSMVTTEQTTEDIRAVLHRTVKRLEYRVTHKQAVTGVPSGFVDFDELTGGLQPGHLWVVAARPAMGKTSFVMNLVVNAACEHKIPALVFTLEMASEELVERSLGAEGRIQSERLRSGFLESRDMISLTKAGARLSDAPICLNAETTTLRGIRAEARRWRSNPRWFPAGEERLGLLVVDYLQLIEGNGKEPREQQIAQVSRGLKLLARKLRLAVVALSQVNRACETRADKRPGLSDLRESGAIEQDADGIAFIYRDEVYNKESPDAGTAEIIVDKQRNGPTGLVQLAFFKPYTRFENLARRSQP